MLSLCMIVKNEKNNLTKYLSQIKNFFEEIIIIDTGSTDQTIKIAKTFTNKVFSFKWCDDFSKAKNYAISKATKKWILFLDADELITNEDLKKIKEAINQNTDAHRIQSVDAYKTQNVDAYRINVINYLNQKVQGAKTNIDQTFNHPFQVSFKLTRLFKNKNYLYKYRVHELIEESIEEQNGTIKELNVNIHHFGTLNLQNKKNDYYEQLVLKQLKELPNNKRALYYAGKVYLSKKNYDKTIELFNQITKIDPAYKNIHAKIGQLYFIKKELNKAINHYKQSLKCIEDNDQNTNNNQNEDNNQKSNNNQKTDLINQKAHLINQLAFLYHKNGQNELSKYLLEEFLKNNELNKETIALLKLNLNRLK